MIDCMQAFVSKVYPNLVFPLLYLGFLRIVLGPVNLFLGLLSDLKKKDLHSHTNFQLTATKKGRVWTKKSREKSQITL